MPFAVRRILVIPAEFPTSPEDRRIGGRTVSVVGMGSFAGIGPPRGGRCRPAETPMASRPLEQNGSFVKPLSPRRRTRRERYSTGNGGSIVGDVQACCRAGVLPRAPYRITSTGMGSTLTQRSLAAPGGVGSVFRGARRADYSVGPPTPLFYIHPVIRANNILGRGNFGVWEWASLVSLPTRRSPPPWPATVRPRRHAAPRSISRRPA